MAGVEACQSLNAQRSLHWRPEQVPIVLHGVEQKLHFVVSPFNNESASLKKLSTSSSHGCEDCGSIRETLAGSGVATGLVPITGDVVSVLLAHPVALSSDSTATAGQNRKAAFVDIDVLLLDLGVARHQRDDSLQVGQRRQRAGGVFLSAVRFLCCEVSASTSSARALYAGRGQRGDEREAEHPQQRRLEVRQHHFPLLRSNAGLVPRLLS